jgi:hypothetical protein
MNKSGIGLSEVLSTKWGILQRGVFELQLNVMNERLQKRVEQESHILIDGLAKRDSDI